MTNDILVLLTGGRADLPRRYRVATVDRLDEQVKVRFAGGYEHFAYRGEDIRVDELVLPVFNWTYRTQIAE
jgi:hypothetical protein